MQKYGPQLVIEHVLLRQHTFVLSQTMLLLSLTSIDCVKIAFPMVMINALLQWNALVPNETGMIYL